MATFQQTMWHDRPGGTLLPSRVLAALDQLTDEEQQAVRQALREIEAEGIGGVGEPRLRRLGVDEPLYVLRPAPAVRLIIRLSPDGSTEVLEIVRPETLRHMFPSRRGAAEDL
jgi:hypothetical protein